MKHDDASEVRASVQARAPSHNVLDAPVDLETHVDPLPIRNDVDVRLLADTDLGTDRGKRVALRHGLDGEKVISSVSEPVAVVCKKSTLSQSTTKEVQRESQREDPHLTF